MPHYCSGCNRNSGSNIDKAIFGRNLRGEFPLGGRFSGDFFRNDYADKDFGYISDEGGERMPPDPDSDDDMPADDLADAVHAQDEDSWEPERPVPSAQEQDLSMEDVQEPPQNCPPPTRETRIAAEDRFHIEPTIEKYRSPRAGKVISEDQAQSGEEQYRSALGDPTNPYASFTSKLDWEVTRCTELCGSGSTAFTDLLKIDGV
ncbi:hypothetical protein B0H17DRAFT_1137243 [Mycena rosella]|uniref:Uncharacterized protein n=1 Tax=Mycena rosella TaxID=1033263 RepID=A0AAD7D9E9_MYCRO|nr:hypothetical protein B0H17DRAFT_1137243 [Mycena rosella]